MDRRAYVRTGIVGCEKNNTYVPATVTPTRLKYGAEDTLGAEVPWLQKKGLHGMVHWKGQH